jgi:hypothetical protein
VAVEAMRCPRSRRAPVSSSLIDAPATLTSVIAQSSAPSVSPSVSVPKSPEMKIATPRHRGRRRARRVLVEVDRRAERQAVVGRAGHGEGDVDVLMELAGVIAASCRRGYPFRA